MAANRQFLHAEPTVLATTRAGQAQHHAGAATVEYGGKICLTCASPDEHDDWNAEARGETPLQRADRAYSEILQEVRVAQTGVQILFAFLLTLAFTNRFTAITQFQKDVYVLTLMLSAAAAALLIAPAAFHRVVYRRRLKQHLVHAASRLALAGLVLLLLAMVSALLLILDVVTGLRPALVLAAGAMAWFIAWWFVLPAWKRLRHQGHQHPRHTPGPRRSPEPLATATDGRPVRTSRSSAGGETGPGQLAEDPVPFSGPGAAGVTPLTVSQQPAAPAAAGPDPAAPAGTR
jgi:Family of unknown function (DUF6328)